MKLVVPPEAAGERLDRFLAACEGVGSRAAAERLLGDGAVLVDGEARPKSHRLTGGESLEVEVPERRETRLEPEPVEGLRVVFEDEHLLVVDKPAGVVVHPAAGHAHGTLVQGLLSQSIEGGEEPERPGIVHRLDRDTSGLLVVARSDEAHRRLQQLLRERELVREYAALVRGRPRSRAGTDRGADRPRPPRADAPFPRHRHSAGRSRRTSRSRSSSPSTRSCACGWRRGGPIRSASTSPPSTCRSPATRRTGSRATSACSDSSCTPRGSPFRIRSATQRST